MDPFSLAQRIVIWAIPVIFAITVHEVAHGWVASRLGDPTAKMLGRLTLNPFKHIDPIGTVVVPLILLLLPGHFMFGWAKPVPVDPRNLKNPRRDMVWVALAGPGANVLMALIWAVLIKLMVWFGPMMPKFAVVIMAMGTAGILINAMLFVLNILPIPPLDGSKVVSGFLPVHAAEQYNKIERYGFIILVALMALGILSKIMWPLLSVFLGLIAAAFGLNLPVLYGLIF